MAIHRTASGISGNGSRGPPGDPSLVDRDCRSVTLEKPRQRFPAARNGRGHLLWGLVRTPGSRRPPPSQTRSRLHANPRGKLPAKLLDPTRANARRANQACSNQARRDPQGVPATPATRNECTQQMTACFGEGTGDPHRPGHLGHDRVPRNDPRRCIADSYPECLPGMSCDVLLSFVIRLLAEGL